MSDRTWTLTPLVAGWTSYDGGTIFGLVPKSVWGELLPPDERNLVRIPNRCLLARNGREIVLVDSGYGGKGSRLDREVFEMDAGNPTVDALARLEIAPTDVTAVVLTHLHFDHAGGATIFDAERKLAPTFPNAKYYASRIEWEDAVDPAPELRAAYPQNNLRPLLDAGIALSFEDGAEILPGLVARIAPGHTRGSAVFEFETADGPALFLGDLAPSHWHAKQLWTTAYDVRAIETRRSKVDVFAAALERKALLYWAHDPSVVSSRIVERRGNNFIVEPVELDELGDVRFRRDN
ncbi:MAG: MBL fold metallo-hydrolase [Thermoguttaceae bacterium]|nr:MBL fold metallo-hydrolase [Thermoguttaceae bacterium]